MIHFADIMVGLSLSGIILCIAQGIEMVLSALFPFKKYYKPAKCKRCRNCNCSRK